MGFKQTARSADEVRAQLLDRETALTDAAQIDVSTLTERQARLINHIDFILPLPTLFPDRSDAGE